MQAEDVKANNGELILGIIGDTFKIIIVNEVCKEDRTKVRVVFMHKGKETCDIIPRSDVFIISSCEFSSLVCRKTGCIHVLDMNLKDIILNFEYGMLYKWRMGKVVRTNFYVPPDIRGCNQYLWTGCESGVGYMAAESRGHNPNSCDNKISVDKFFKCECDGTLFHNSQPMQRSPTTSNSTVRFDFRYKLS